MFQPRRPDECPECRSIIKKKITNHGRIYVVPWKSVRKLWSAQPAWFAVVNSFFLFLPFFPFLSYYINWQFRARLLFFLLRLMFKKNRFTC